MTLRTLAAVLALLMTCGMSFAENQTGDQPAKSSNPKAAEKTAESPAAASADEQEPAADKEVIERASYFFGMQVGMDLARRGFTDLDPDQIAKGMADVLGNQKPRFTQRQIHEAMIAYQQHIEAKQQQYNQAVAAMGEQNRIKGKAFLAANKQAEGVITTKSGLQYKVLKEGEGPTPTANGKFKAHYRGTLLDGSEFDSSYKRGRPLEMPVTDVIEGWQEALQLMPVGSKWRLFVPAHLAYKDSLRGPGGPGSTLIFDIELLGFTPAGGTAEQPTE